MKNQPIILTVSGDPGGANAIAPVIALLQQEQKVKLINYTYNQASDIFTYLGIPHMPIQNEIDLHWIKQALKTHQASFLLTATSHNAYNWEKYFIAAAHELKIETLSLLDYWSNYALRFSDELGDLIYLPKQIAVMDERAKQEMQALGIAENRLIITGQPAFDSLLEERQAFSTEKKHLLRQSLGLKTDELLVIFASQPFKKFYGEPSGTDYLGYDELSVLTEVVQTLESIAERYEKRITLLIMPHPRENETDYIHFQSPIINIEVSKTHSPRAWVMAADLVLGMTTALLIEACYLQCIVVSLQPELTKPDTLPSNATGASIAVYHEKDIYETIEKYLLDETSRNRLIQKLKQMTPYSNAARCIADYIYQQTPMFHYAPT